MTYINENALRRALQYIDNNPYAKVTRVAEQFRVPRGQLRSRINGRQAGSRGKKPTARLTIAEEKAICSYIDRLDCINLNPNHALVTDAANAILKARTNPSSDKPPPTVGPKWTARFIKRYGYSRVRQKKMDAAREASEDIEAVNEYFHKLREAIAEWGIHTDDIWNMDETGFRLAMANDAFIITKRKRAHYFALPENRESATCIEAISTAGRVAPLFTILSGQNHMAPWYQLPELTPECSIAVSETGYTNDELSLAWIQHFDRNTAKHTVGSKRLLIIDGHGSHHTKEFIEYCYAHDIIPFGLPPHLTHILQPLDVVVFQPLKHYHTKTIEVMVRDGLTNIGKLEFLATILDVRKQAFKSSTIASAFKKTGIEPWNPQPVLDKMVQRNARFQTPPPAEVRATDLGAPESSPIAHTPLTLRHLNKRALEITEELDKVKSVLEMMPDLEDVVDKVSSFVKGALINTTELLQVKRDLGRTEYAQRVSKARRSKKNTPLQSGGVLTVEEGRAMVRKRAEDDLEKARKLVETAEKKEQKANSAMRAEVAKIARKMRLDGRLQPIEVIDEKGRHTFLKRG